MRGWRPAQVLNISRYAFEVLRRDGEYVLYRGQTEDDAVPVLVLSPTGEDLTQESLRRLRHAYSLKEELDPSWAARPIAIAHHWDRTVLVMEDPGGLPLDQLLGQPLDSAWSLRIAISLSSAIGHLHGRGIIHKDIKPAHVLVSPNTSQCWLMGFGISSRLPRERQSPGPPEFIAGTLPYMAPEQTGRMNRSIDSRSDLYSLGVLLYEMLTGSLPFTATDPMEWVHCHIARQPVPPSQRGQGVQPAISAVVIKLLAKTAEERYQTAIGVEYDLRRCLDAVETSSSSSDSTVLAAALPASIAPFALGTHDISDQLRIPERLYGRAHEIDTLLASFDRVVASGAPELVLVSGYSGIGKSSVVNELHALLVQPRGLFASGKFDQYKRDIPYATLAQAFQSLIRPLLGKGEAELRNWRDALCEALGPNGLLMVDLVPELKLVIGEQLPVPELPPQDAQRRFQLVFRRFIGVFARPEHPLALFLDDLQWLDAATLDLLEDLLTRPDVQHLMLIGAYRDNEADSTHPLVRKLEAIRQSGATVHEIILAPLAREDLGRLIADALHCEPERVTPLAQLVQEKTAGNPFFVIQFIRALVEEAFLTFEHGGGGWSWDLSRIHDKGYTDNVVDLMIGKVNRLPVETQKALQEFACLGNSAEIKTLSAVCATSEEELHSNLWEAVRLEYIRRSEDSYIFGHDRVQEAAYSLIPEKLRAEAHVRIGRILRVRTPADKLEERIFEIVNQFNRSTALIVTQREREQVAELNLLAGKRAKSATAYASALRYLTAGRTLLGENAWEECNQLTFQLELNHAECEYLTGKLALAEEHLSALSTRAQSIFESAAVSCMRINLYTTLDRSDSAVEVGLDYLRRVDEGWPTHPTADHVQQEYSRLWLELGSRPIEAMLDLPLMSDAEKSATMDVLTVLTIPALFTDLNLCRLIVGRMATLSLEHGNCDGSCLAYEWLGGVLGTYFGKYEAGFRFGKLGLKLVEKHGLDRFKARVYVVFAVHVAHWTQPLQISRDVLRRGFLAARDAGDLSYATYSCIDLITNRFAAGDPLSEVEREAEDGLEFARKACFGLAIDCITGQLRLIRMLRGRTPDFTSFNDAEFDEERFAQHLENNPQLAIGACYYWVRKLQACVYAGDGASGIVAASKVASLLWTAPAQFEHAEYHFYGALARAAHCDKVLVEERSQHVEALAAQHKLLTIWAENCPENFENRAALVGAEIARIQGRELDAERLYEQAIRSSNANGFVQNEALANELAARFYMARGFEKIAYAYLRDARHNYVRWGAAGKVRQLDELYPQFKADEQAAAPTSTIRTPIEHLDLATVIKVSQAVSREVVSEKLIDTIMRTAIQYAGASRGLLIVPLGDQRRIEAEAATTGDTIIVRVSETSGADAAVPDTIVHYVARTHESLILDDASADNPFSADPYFREQPARSILCLPLINQAKLIAVLYLENNLAPRIFTPARITVLKLLAAQAAISLENTFLYGALEEREAALRRSETYLSEAQRLSQTGSFGWDVESGEIYWSQETFRIFEYDPTTEPGLELILHRTHPADRSRVRELIDRVSAERKDFDFEHRLLVPDGSVKYLRVVGHPSTREKSGRFEFVGAVMDITEQKRAEEELRRSQAYLAEAESLSKCGSWALKPATKEITYWSPERYHLFGFDPDAGKPSYEAVLQRIHPEDRTRWLESTEDAVRERRDSDLEFRVVLPHGEIKHLYGVGHPVFSETGELVEVIGAAIDITERKRVERELHQKEVSLREAQSSLAHVSRVTTMGELAASIAHEVNQPLVGVVANAGAGLRYLGWDTPNLVEAKEAIRRIIRDGNRAAEVVSRMRALFKKTRPVKEALNINEAIEEVVLLTQGEARRNKVKLRVEPYTNLALVMADRVQVQQVLMNLILNGIQAMSEVQDRERFLVVSAQSGEGDEIRVAVQDCGIGIDPGDMERIFDAFHTTKPGGMGMGLSISRSIVESHGGRLWATPNDGPGVTFQFTL